MAGAGRSCREAGRELSEAQEAPPVGLKGGSSPSSGIGKWKAKLGCGSMGKGLCFTQCVASPNSIQTYYLSDREPVTFHVVQSMVTLLCPSGGSKLRCQGVSSTSTGRSSSSHCLPRPHPFLHLGHPALYPDI